MQTNLVPVRNMLKIQQRKTIISKIILGSSELLTWNYIIFWKIVDLFIVKKLPFGGDGYAGADG